MHITMLASLLDKTWAVARRDFLTATRYRASLFIAVAGGLFEIAGLYYLAKAIGPGFRPEGMDSYSFLLAGTGLYTFLLMGISCFLSAIQEAQQAGTLEVLMTSSTSPSVLLLLSAISSFAGKGLAFLAYLVGGLALTGTRFAGSSLLPSCVVILLSLAIAAGIGVATAGCQLLLQKGSGIVWLLGSVIWLMTGAMFPISALPRWLQYISNAIPLTHCLTAMRLALFTGGFPPALLREISVLTASAVFLLPASLLFFAASLRHARLSGTLAYS
jgi:ABC-2 type transport system permease protein